LNLKAVSVAGLAVVMCGVSAKDARMVEIVVSRAPNLKYAYQLTQSSNATACNFALVDANSPTGISELTATRTRFGNIPAVFISDDGTRGDSNYKIARRSLLLHVLRTFDEISAGQMKLSIGQAPVKTNVAESKPEVPVAIMPVAPVAKLEPLSALVVDDSLTIRTQLNSALERIGLKGTLAEDATHAMAEVQKRRFDVIFLDVVMPGADGYALCRQIKSSPATRAIPVIMLTSRSSPFDRARGALAGCDTYLTKPIDLKSFYRAVDKVLLKAFKEDRTLMTQRGYKLLAF
jgi:two-component system, cell cycle response regulator